MSNFTISHCYNVAGKAFAKWWIPLSVISGILVLFQLIPQLMTNTEVQEIKGDLLEVLFALKEQNFYELDKLSIEIVDKCYALSLTLLQMTLYIFPITALLTIFLLMQANLAVKDKKKRDISFIRATYLAFVHVVLAVIKLIAFLFFIAPGVYIYTKLLFVSLIMLEEKKGVREAIILSWKMTKGHFWPLLGLLLLNTAIQSAALPTIIGLIPATAFVNTARAAAFQELRKREEVDEKSS